jgi:hypothetical protein
MNIIEKILYFFGFVTKKRAKWIIREIVLFINEDLFLDIKKHHNIKRNDNFYNEVKEYIKDFYKIMETGNIKQKILDPTWGEKQIEYYSKLRRDFGWDDMQEIEKEINKYCV